MPRWRPDRPGARWVDQRTGLRWRTVDETHVALESQPPSRRPPSGRRDGYHVTADDIVVAGGAALAAYYADEVALWVEAAKLAYEFNRTAKQVEGTVDDIKDIKGWLNEVLGTRNSASGSSAGGTSYAERRPRMIIPVGAVVQGFNTYPGKLPPGYHPGLGPGGTRQGARAKFHSQVRYERS